VKRQATFKRGPFLTGYRGLTVAALRRGRAEYVRFYHTDGAGPSWPIGETEEMREERKAAGRARRAAWLRKQEEAA